VISKRLIVQSWRSPNWTDNDIDSTLILTFLPEGEAGRIELTHVNVVEKDFAGVSQGWEKYYWTPWRAYLEAN
jgi:Activator of Hsp90 ATPase homolog 1-like protein